MEVGKIYERYSVYIALQACWTCKLSLQRRDDSNCSSCCRCGLQPACVLWPTKACLQLWMM